MTDPSSPTHGQLAAKERERRMRELALDCLVKALKCLVVWYEEMDMGKDVITHNGIEPQTQITHGNSITPTISESDANQIIQV